ncbi:hypothetical protein B484DRAFT_459276 [Ochromonadaceae sp. CCMP2298]|nr:hypothetical protein B484DRAFT_459276 [Ochromonadaceae sp. CCMP2298]
MPYIRSDGSVQESRSLFRLSLISDVFWYIANTIGLFFNTLVDPRAALPAGRYQVRRGESAGGRGTSAGSASASASASAGSGSGTGGAPKAPHRGPNIKTLPKNCATGG